MPRALMRRQQAQPQMRKSHQRKMVLTWNVMLMAANSAICQAEVLRHPGLTGVQQGCTTRRWRSR